MVKSVHCTQKTSQLDGWRCVLANWWYATGRIFVNLIHLVNYAYVNEKVKVVSVIHQFTWKQHVHELAINSTCNNIILLHCDYSDLYENSYKNIVEYFRAKYLGNTEHAKKYPLRSLANNSSMINDNFIIFFVRLLNIYTDIFYRHDAPWKQSYTVTILLAKITLCGNYDGHTYQNIAPLFSHSYTVKYHWPMTKYHVDWDCRQWHSYCKRWQQPFFSLHRRLKTNTLRLHLKWLCLCVPVSVGTFPTVLQLYDAVGWVVWPVKLSPKWCTMRRVRR